MDGCPTCYRPFKDFRDFPRIYVHSTGLISPQDVPGSVTTQWLKGQDRASQIRQVLETDPWIQQYRQALDDLVGKEVIPSQVVPDWGDDIGITNGIFYLVPGTAGWYMEDGEPKVDDDVSTRSHKDLHLSVHDGPKQQKRNGHRVAKIKLFRNVSHGYVPLLDIGHVEYEGLLKP